MLTRDQAEAAAETVLQEARMRQARVAGKRKDWTAAGTPRPWAAWALAGVLVGLAYDWLSPGSTSGSIVGLAVGSLFGRWRVSRAAAP